jgi:hypothetical protein
MMMRMMVQARANQQLLTKLALLVLELTKELGLLLVLDMLFVLMTQGLISPTQRKVMIRRVVAVLVQKLLLQLKLMLHILL